MNMQVAPSSPVPPRVVALGVAMTVLAILAPLAVVLSFRLALETCIILNPFGLPWPSAAKTVVRIAAALIIVASTVGLIFGARFPTLAALRRGLIVYSLVSIFPAFLLLLLSVYGDPGPNCVVG